MGALRLVLSTYRDFSGQNQTKYDPTSGFCDFERCLANVLGGAAVKIEGVFNIIVAPSGGTASFGISCNTARFVKAQNAGVITQRAPT